MNTPYIRLQPLMAAENGDADTAAPTDSYYDYADTPEEQVAMASGVWTYMFTVSFLLIFWVLMLMLPKGFRKQVFGSQPRRYARRRYAATEIGEMSTTMGSSTIDESMLREVEQCRMNDISLAPSSKVTSIAQYTNATSTMNLTATQAQNPSMLPQQPLRTPKPPRSTISDTESSFFLRPLPRHPRSNNNPFSGLLRSPSPAMMGLPPPSPQHPSIPRLPSAKILNETMQRLKTRGIRLVAHGVASESKRVWIKFEEDTMSLSWQTEFPRKIPNQLGEVSLVMMRGALHRIALPNILYVDVGKKTNALMKEENKNISDSICFSLLTQNGSLDLQANSRLERDALVSCFSMVLDEVHTQDWRSLYAESDTSAMQSTCTGSDLDMVEF